uniref:Uncharacterized protein n=1 Tax=Haptolina brevifila TaxID=156173 RepID=A0A7S2GMA5_9EUKA
MAKAILTKARPTGYDEGGRLVPMLSSSQKKAKHKKEAEREERRARGVGWDLHAAEKVSDGMALIAKGATSMEKRLDCSAAAVSTAIHKGAIAASSTVAKGAHATNAAARTIQAKTRSYLSNKLAKRKKGKNRPRTATDLPVPSVLPPPDKEALNLEA